MPNVPILRCKHLHIQGRWFLCLAENVFREIADFGRDNVSVGRIKTTSSLTVNARVYSHLQITLGQTAPECPQESYLDDPRSESLVSLVPPGTAACAVPPFYVYPS